MTRSRTRRTDVAASVVLTCEHGGNDVPPEYRDVLAPVRSMLPTHRGFDPGTIELAETLRSALGSRTPLIVASVTRLLVDLNRSIDHPGVLGPSLSGLSEPERARVFRRYYQPHRGRVERVVAQRASAAGGCVHVGVHSFTPVLKGKRRDVDIGLLFDPARAKERSIVALWISALELFDLGLKIKRNSPYRGTSDGLTTSLRKLHADQAYAGIELEVNQRLVRAGGPRWQHVQDALAASLLVALHVHLGGDSRRQNDSTARGGAKSKRSVRAASKGRA